MSRVKRNSDGSFTVLMPKGVHSEMRALEADTLEEGEHHTPKGHFVKAHQSATTSGTNMKFNVSRQGLDYLARSAIPNAVGIWSPEAGGGSRSRLTNAAWTRSAEALQDEAKQHLTQQQEKPVATMYGKSIAQMQEGEQRFQREHRWQRLMSSGADHQAIVREMSHDEKKEHLARLNAAPGDNPAARRALEGKPMAEKHDPMAEHAAQRSREVSEQHETRQKEADYYFKKGDVHARLANDASVRGDHAAATRHSNAAAIVYGAAHSIKRGVRAMPSVIDDAEKVSDRAHAADQPLNQQRASGMAGALGYSKAQVPDKPPISGGRFNDPDYVRTKLAERDSFYAKAPERGSFANLVSPASRAQDEEMHRQMVATTMGVTRVPQPAPPAQKAAIAAAAKPKMGRSEARAAGGRWETGPKGGAVWVTANGTRIYGRKPKG